MSAVGGNTAGPGDAVVKFAFVEMSFAHLQGVPVKVKRPTDYNPSLAAALGPKPNPNLNLAAVRFSSMSTGGLEDPDRIFVGGIPYYFTEDQIREVLESFEPLRGFNLVKDMETGNSMGYAFCVYQDPSVTDIACIVLTGIKMGNKALTVRRAVQGAVQHEPEQEDIFLHAQQQIALQRLTLQPGGTPTKIVCLTQVVTADDLGDDEEYEYIMADMKQEGGKFGNLVNVVIPRPNPDQDPAPGIGKVFLEYADVDGAAKARSGMNGRTFGGNQVVAVYYLENKYAQGDYEGC
ncbi:RNA recognition motif domain-containing protein [Hirschfeldia incana]|nr:RNA recognition motif domain-containing protein [Hirschfeldia incana]